MNDWRGRVTLAKLAEGCTVKESATSADVSRVSVWLWCQVSTISPPRSPRLLRWAERSGPTGFDSVTHSEANAHPRAREVAGNCGSAPVGGETVA